MTVDLQLYPTCASAVVPIYNLNGKANLVLTMQVGDGWRVTLET